MSGIRDLAMYASTYPVPEGPLTVKLSSRLVELKAKSVTVEFDAIEKTSWLFWAVNGIITRLTTELALE